MKPVRALLTLIPFVWMIAMIPFVNRVRPLVFGLPFLAFWIVLGIFVGSLCLSVLYRMDTKNRQDS
jgi:hypothetical protein